MKKALFITRKFFLLLITCSFIQNISLAQSPPNLGAASSFVLFTGVGAFSNIGAATYVTGDVGTNVGAFTAFPPGTVVGQIHVADPTSAQAATDVDTAYSYLSRLTCGSVIGTTLGSGQILTPNIYCLGAASSLNGNLILDGQGNPNSLFIFKINGALSTSTFANVTLINSASICNVYWQINGAFSLGDNSVFRGTIVADGAISLLEGSSLLGRGLSTAGAIDLHDNFVAIGMQPTATITAVGGSTTLCSGGSVTLSVSVSNGIRPYSYLWSPGGQTDSSITVSPTVTTTYTVDVTAINGCSDAIDTIIVTVNPAATASANVDQTICAGSTVTLAGSIGGSASSGTWSGGTGIFSPDATTLNATYTPSAGEVTAGTLTLTLTTNDPAGLCGAVSDQMVITINPVATVDANVDQTICAGSTVTLAGSIGGSATTSTWTTSGTGIFSPDANTLNATYTPSVGEVTAGTVTLTLTTNDPDGPCGAVSDQMVITINHAVAVDLGNDTTISICTGSLILDAGNTGSSFLWNTTATTQTISVNASGTYYVTVTNGTATHGNCTASDTIHITVLPLTVNLGNDTLLCAGASIILDAGNSGSNFLWNTTATTQTISVNASGTYYVTVINGNCTASDTIHVTVLPLLTVNLGKDTIITTCKDDSLLLDAGVLGSSYLWSTGATTQTIYVSSTGTYYVDVTNAGGCTASDTIHVVIYTTMHVNFGPDTTVCGCILLNAYTSGATSYQWCSGGSNYTIKNVCVTGMYCVIVSNGVCTASDTINITVLQLPVVNLGNDTTITTSIILNAGNTGSSFSWNTGATTQTITVNTSGIYYVTVTNTLGCSFTDTIHITAPVGINNFSGKQDFKIYPNPNNGTMQLEYYISEGTSGEFLLYDMTGRKVMKTILKGGYNQITISNGNLLDGIYLVQLISNNKIIAQNKLIINR